MGKLRKYLFSIWERAEDILAKDKPAAIPSVTIPIKEKEYVMPHGVKLSKEELIEEDKFIISKLDNKLNLLITMIQDIHPDEDMQDAIVTEPFLMKVWLAHIAYKTKISDFNSLLTGQKTLKSKRIKCLTDLPLQKTLLN
jgi:hypothetical protein